MRRVFFIAAAALLLTAAIVDAQGLRGIQRRRLDTTHSIRSAGLERTYHVHTPRGYDSPRDNLPVVLAFHGGTAKGTGMPVLTGLNELADEARFIAVYPEGVDEHWNDGRSSVPNTVDDVAFVSAMLEDLARNYRIDANRIYAAGISNGGFFSERLACEMAESRFWAAANKCAPRAEHISLPDRAPRDGTSIIRETHRCGNVEVTGYTVQNGGHTWPGGTQYAPERLIGKTTRDLDGSRVIWEFFKQHTLH